MNHNIIWKVTAQYMKRNRRRTAITFVGIVFMVMLMTCVFAGRETVMSYLCRVAALDKGSWHLIAYDLTPEEAERIESQPEVMNAGRTSTLGVLDFPQTGDSVNKPFLDVRAYSTEAFSLLNIALTEGRYPQNAHELILSQSVLEDGASIAVGDRISGDFFDRTITGINPDVAGTMFTFEKIELHYGETLKVSPRFMPYLENEDYTEGRELNGRSGDYTVVGFMETPVSESPSGACYVALCGMEDEVFDTVNTALVLDLDQISSGYEFRHQLWDLTGREFSVDTNELLLAFSAKGADSNINTLTIFVEVFFTVLIMAASVILIYNVFNMSFAERARYLGMLSSVGATRRQKRQSIYFECAALLIPALPLGIGTGLLGVKASMLLLKPNLDKLIAAVKFGVKSDIPVPLHVSMTGICLIVGMCIVTVMISALIPAVKISRISPVESIRGNDENSGKKRFRTKKGLLEKGKPEWLLALSSTGRCRHLTRSIIRSIAVFGVLTMVLLYGAQSVIHVLDVMTDEGGWIYVPEGYSYFITVNDGEDGSRDSLKQMLESEPSVTNCREISCGYAGIRLNGDALSDAYFDALKEIYLQYADNTEESWEEFREMIDNSTDLMIIVPDDEEYQYLAQQGDADPALASDPSVPSMLLHKDVLFTTDYYRIGNALKGYRCITVDEPFRAEKGGDIKLSVYDPSIECLTDTTMKVAGFTNAASVSERYKISPQGLYAFLNRAAYEQIKERFELHSYSTFLFSAEGEAGDAFVKDLSDLCEQTMNEGLSEIYMGNYADRDSETNIKQVLASIIHILAYCFTALVSVVCLLNLYNSIRGRAAERTRETAVLRSMGMTDRQLTRMHDYENLLLLGKGLAIAAVVCAVLCIVMNRFFTSYFGSLHLPFPGLLSLCIAAAICAASVLMTRICTRSTGSTGIVEEIRRETV